MERTWSASLHQTSAPAVRLIQMKSQKHFCSTETPHRLILVHHQQKSYLVASKPVKFRREWLELTDLHEKAANQLFTKNKTKRVHDRHLNPLKVGEPVPIQNQHRHQSQRWNNTSTIVEALPHKQYHVLVNGSRRTTLRNRRFLRKKSGDTGNMNLGNSPPDLNKASDINDHPTPVILPPESHLPIHLEQQDLPPTNEPPMLCPTTTVSNKWIFIPPDGNKA